MELAGGNDQVASALILYPHAHNDESFGGIRQRSQNDGRRPYLLHVDDRIGDEICFSRRCVGGGGRARRLNR